MPLKRLFWKCWLFTIPLTGSSFWRENHLIYLPSFKTKKSHFGKEETKGYLGQPVYCCIFECHCFYSHADVKTASTFFVSTAVIILWFQCKSQQLLTFPPSSDKHVSAEKNSGYGIQAAALFVSLISQSRCSKQCGCWFFPLKNLSPPAAPVTGLAGIPLMPYLLCCQPCFQ